MKMMRLLVLSALVATAVGIPKCSTNSASAGYCCTCDPAALKLGPKACAVQDLKGGSDNCVNGNDLTDGVYTGSVFISNSADNRTRVDLTGIKEIKGDLQIKGISDYTTRGPTEFDVIAPDLVNVTGNVVFFDTKLLKAISLPKLKRIDGELYIQSNAHLNKLDITSLETVGGKVYLSYNSLSGTLELSKLKSVGDLKCSEKVKLLVTKCVDSDATFDAAFISGTSSLDIDSGCTVGPVNATALNCSSPPPPPSPPTPPPPPSPTPPPAVSTEFALSITVPPFMSNEDVLKSAVAKVLIGGTSKGSDVTIIGTIAELKITASVLDNDNMDLGALASKIGRGLKVNAEEIVVTMKKSRRSLLQTISVLEVKYSADSSGRVMETYNQKKMEDVVKAEKGVQTIATTITETYKLKVPVPPAKTAEVDAIIKDKSKLQQELSKAQGKMTEVVSAKQALEGQLSGLKAASASGEGAAEALRSQLEAELAAAKEACARLEERCQQVEKAHKAAVDEAAVAAEAAAVRLESVEELQRAASREGKRTAAVVDEAMAESDRLKARLQETEKRAENAESLAASAQSAHAALVQQHSQAVAAAQRKEVALGEELAELQVRILPNSQYPARSHSHSLIFYRMFG